MLLRPLLLAYLLAGAACASGIASPPGQPSPEPTPTAQPAAPPPIAVSDSTPIPKQSPSGPLEITAGIEPGAVPQGRVATIRIQSNWPVVGIEGRLDGRPVAFDWEGNQGWAFLGFNSQAGLGPRRLTVTVTGSNGDTASTGLALQVVGAEFPVEHIRIPAPPPAPPGAPAPVDPLAPSVMSREWSRLIGITGQVTPRRYWTQPFMLPSQGQISSYYGTRRSYNGGPPVEPHQGMDFSAPAGSPVSAANSGIATVARWDVRGNLVLIDHGLGLWSGYYHLSETVIADGQHVERGQPIGKLGSTGLATGPHLHWDMVIHGVHVDPLAWTDLTPRG